jgi:hypothetical protein
MCGWDLIVGIFIHLQWLMNCICFILYVWIIVNNTFYEELSIIELQCSTKTFLYGFITLSNISMLLR